METPVHHTVGTDVSTLLPDNHRLAADEGGLQTWLAQDLLQKRNHRQKKVSSIRRKSTSGFLEGSYVSRAIRSNQDWNRLLITWKEST